MSRPRRTRKSKSMAVACYDLDEEESDDITGMLEKGPSTKLIPSCGDEADSGSHFTPNQDTGLSQEGPGGGNDDKEPDGYPGQRQIDNGVVTANGKERGRGKPTATIEATKPTSDVTTLSRSSKRQTNVLPTPSVNHRHRAVPLFSRTGRVERLVTPPILFRPSVVTLTNSFTQNAVVTDRIYKAWGYNVGSGPLWELVEDRGWYKEARETEKDSDCEGNRRPRVYQGIHVNSWEVLNKNDAAPYLPTDVVTTVEGNLKPPPPVSCFFGPRDSQTRLEMQIFQSQNMSELISESKAHVFNAGSPVWGLDWCPTHPDNRRARSYKQYLAVGPFPTRSHSPEIGVRVPRPCYACVQIWSFGPTLSTPQLKTSQNTGKVRCELVLCLDGGPAHELKWCPLPSHDATSESKRPRNLGLLAGTFEDGSLSIYTVPDPADVAPPDHDTSHPVYVKISEPLVRIEMEETNCWTFDWGNSEIIAIGTTNGIIAVYDIGPSLKSYEGHTVTKLIPTHYISVHQSAIRALAWIRAPPSRPTGTPGTDQNPTVITSGGYDGVECMTDIREGHGSVMNRTRDVINSMTFSPFCGGPITIDHENTVKAYSASPSMLGRGHTLFEPQGPVWTVDASDYHPQLAVGSADGSCTTTNTLRSTRRGGSVPFFVHPIYQLDYSRNTGEYQMLERILPQETQDRPTATRAAKLQAKESTTKVNPVGTGAWPREVGVHRVTWNSCNGLAAAGFLASATASGLCRVDVLWGRWIKGKVPYGGIEHIRRELDGDGVMDVDSDDSSRST